MKALRMMLLLGAVACTTQGAALEPSGAADIPTASGPFSGTWEACEGASAPEECSRYVLVQRGERICGTWSYVASGRAYEGRVVANVTTATQATRTHVCGRPGSETSTTCEDGWQSIERPFVLCEGGLADLVDEAGSGSCLADYRPVPTLAADEAALMTQPWMQKCLTPDR